jgi:MFS family permease
MGSINSYPQYREYFGFPINGGTPSTGIVYAIYTIGNLVGSFAAGPACDTFGKYPAHHLICLKTYNTRATLGHVHWSTNYSYWNLHPSSFN